MNQLSDWLFMGGYSVYIWPAYGLVIAVLVINVLGLRWQKNSIRSRLQNWFKRTDT